MPLADVERLRAVRTLEQLVEYLRDELAWPIEEADFEDLVFDYTPAELGLDPAVAAKCKVRQLRPLVTNQPWGIFFVEFEPKRLPIAALRRILSRLATRKRARATLADNKTWCLDDLLFISSYGERDRRQITFAHFSEDPDRRSLPALRVLGWDNLDTPLHLDDVADVLLRKLAWPDDETNTSAWRETWRSAFTLRHREVITTSKALALRLAELARVIRDRIRSVIALEAPEGDLRKLMKAFQESLVHDLSEEDFADTYAQTIAYGLLSARVASPEAKARDGFGAKLPVTNPFLRELMETFLDAGARVKTGRPGIDFDELGVSEVVEALDDANMEAVVRDFGDRNPQEDPVIHFYELFLKEYDAKKRMQRGVFYTPRPVVSFIVRSVDELLRTEFGLEDGLADTATWGDMGRRHKDLKVPEGVSPDEDFIQILDPACGTGTFLVEAIDLVHKTLVTKWEAQGLGANKTEELWNDYVPRHLLPRLHGYELLMAPYAIAHLKIGLKLHETGYRFGSEVRARIYLTNALEPAQDFSGRFEFAIPALAHEAQAVNEIKRRQRFSVVIGNPPYSRASANRGAYAETLVRTYKNLVRAERNIQPLSDDYIKFVGLAQKIIEQSRCGVVGMITNNTFLSGRIHRGMRETLLAGNPLIKVVNLHGSQKVGYLGDAGLGDQNVFDILQGVSISLMVRGGRSRGRDYSELIGSRDEKYGRLLEARLDFDRITPEPPYYLLVPSTPSSAEYRAWPSLTEIIQFQSVCGKPGDDDLLVGFDESDTIPKLKEFSRKMGGAIGGARLTEAGRNLAALAPDHFEQQRVIRYAYRPFDTRYAYYDSRIWTRPLERLQRCIDGSPILLTTKLVKDGSFAHVFVTRLFCDVIFLSSTSSVNCYAFPMRAPQNEGTLLPSFADSNYRTAVVGSACMMPVSPQEALEYIYSVLHSPTYREAYLDSLRLDFPRIPVTAATELLLELAALGKDLIALHLMESPRLEQLVTTYSGPKNPMVRRVAWFDETVWLDAPTAANSRAVSPDVAGFHGVPEAVWEFHIGGYQVCEKWLKDRKGRVLSDEDIIHYQKIVVALNETIRIMGEIDEVIEKHGGWPDAFRGA